MSSDDPEEHKASKEAIGEQLADIKIADHFGQLRRVSTQSGQGVAPNAQVKEYRTNP